MMLEAVCLLSLMGYGHGFLMYGSTTGWRRRQDGNLKGLMKLETAAGTVVDEEVLISFKPSEVEVCKDCVEYHTLLLLFCRCLLAPDLAIWVSFERVVAHNRATFT